MNKTILISSSLFLCLILYSCYDKKHKHNANTSYRTTAKDIDVRYPLSIMDVKLIYFKKRSASNYKVHFIITNTALDATCSDVHLKSALFNKSELIGEYDEIIDEIKANKAVSLTRSYSVVTKVDSIAITPVSALITNGY